MNNDVLFCMEDSVLLKGVGCIGHVSATIIDICTSGFMAVDDVGFMAVEPCFHGNCGGFRDGVKYKNINVCRYKHKTWRRPLG